MKGFSDNGPIGISAEVMMELWSKQKKDCPLRSSLLIFLSTFIINSRLI